MGLVYGREQDGTIIPELSTCGLANKLPYSFELSSVLFFLAPWTLIVVLYILIGLKLYKSKRDSSRTTCSAHCRHTACLSSTNTRATGRVVKMLGEYLTNRYIDIILYIYLYTFFVILCFQKYVYKIIPVMKSNLWSIWVRLLSFMTQTNDYQ